MRPISTMKRIFLLFVLVIICVSGAISGTRYRVMDERLSVYGDPDRFNRLGYMYRGDEFEATGMDGTLLIFEYNGRKAYTASYCCKEIEETAPSEYKAISPVKKKAGTESVQAETASPVAESSSEEAAGEKNMEVNNHPACIAGTSNSHKGNSEVPEWVAGILAMIMFMGVIVGFWTIFGHGSCESFFDRLADAYISSGSVWRRFRPLLVMVIGGITYNFTLSISAAFVVAVIYEAIVIAVRAKRWRSLRAAIVEAVYLLLAGIGAVAFCVLLLFFAFLASGGSGKSGNASSSAGGTGSSRSRSCSNCRHINWNLKCPYHEYPNANSCGDYDPL